MKVLWSMLLIVSLGIIFAVEASGSTSYIGHSGAPGRLICSISCHHRHNFEPTIRVTGFPESYMPGQQYIIYVAHDSGSSIRQFNCSIRIGNDTTNAGLVSAGAGTETYSTRGETNGVHFSSYGRDSANFIWTAPVAGTGEVRLYWAGLQGILSNGADTQIILISAENTTGTGLDTGLPRKVSLAQNYPNPFNSETMISFYIPYSDKVEISIHDILGRKIYSIKQKIQCQGNYSIRWDGRNSNGSVMPSGVYFYRIQTSNLALTKRMILLR
jgi:hypothetical protein